MENDREENRNKCERNEIGGENYPVKQIYFNF